MHQTQQTTPSILLIIIATIALTHTTPCTATNPQNTLAQTTSYHFDPGYYNVIKYAENSTADYWIMQQTEIPYLNITYTAPSHGYLSITLHPTEGYVPHIQLSPGWDTDGLTYTHPMLLNETSYMLLTPPMRFSDQNTSSIVGGSIMKWEVYNWGNTTGTISYVFTASEDITLELVMYPTNPKHDETINLFTDSNADIKEITWNIPEIGWINQTETLEITTLEAGTYTVNVQGIDDFNKTHHATRIFTVYPPTLNPQIYELSFFSVTYPEAAEQGSTVTITATIDYSLPVETILKCQLIEPTQNIILQEQTYNVSLSGSKQFTHQITAQEVGTKALLLRLYYDTGSGWIEETASEQPIIFTVTANDTNLSIPGYNHVSILAGITLIILYLTQKNN